MLEELKINRFKSARDVHLLLGRVNLFIGGNGSGKSNLLEAIGVIAAALSRGISDQELSRKGVRLTPSALMKSAFKNYDLPKTLRLEALLSNDVRYDLELKAGESSTGLSFFSERVTRNGEKILGRSGAGARVNENPLRRKVDGNRSLWDQIRSAFDFSGPLENEFDALARYAIYAPQTEFLREIKPGTAADPPVGLHGEGLGLAVESLLQQLREARRNRTPEGKKRLNQIETALSLVWLPRWASGLRVGSIDPILKSRGSSSLEGSFIHFIDKFMHEKRNTLSAYDSSEGTLFLVFMAVILSHEESPPLMALDNVDNALNPSLTRGLLETIIKQVKYKQASGLKTGPDQVFLTSHNPTALDAFDLFDDDQRVFVVRRNDKGHTIVDRLKPRKGWTREEWELAFKGKKLSQLWIDGEIVGALGGMEGI